MKAYAEEEGIMSQSQKMLILSFTLQNATLITSLLLSYLNLGLIVTKIHRYNEYIPKNSFNGFVQSAVDARGQSHENANSSVVAEIMKMIARSSNGYQIMD